MILIPLTLFFSGCSSKDRNIKVDGEITSISISQNNMDRGHSYAFSAYKQDERYYLNAWCLLALNQDDYCDVTLEDILITKEEFDEFTKLDKKYNFFKYLKKERKFIRAIDKTTTKFSVSYDGEGISLETDNECYEAVYTYFLELVQKYKN